MRKTSTFASIFFLSQFKIKSDVVWDATRPSVQMMAGIIPWTEMTAQTLEVHSETTSNCSTVLLSQCTRRGNELGLQVSAILLKFTYGFEFVHERAAVFLAIWCKPLPTVLHSMRYCACSQFRMPHSQTHLATWLNFSNTARFANSSSHNSFFPLVSVMAMLITSSGD